MQLVRLSRRADLLVVGHRKRNALARFAKESVADELAQLAACPLMIVPSGARI